MHKNQKEWMAELRRKKVLWIHDGHPSRPHALLTSGQHSGAFFNGRLVIGEKRLLSQAASDLVELFNIENTKALIPQGVIGPQSGGTLLAKLLKKRINHITGRRCFSISPGKQVIEGKKRMVFDQKDLHLVAHQNVILCDDVLTTSESVKLTISATEDAKGLVLPFILVLVNRSNLTCVNGAKIIALINYAAPIWTPKECPYCKQGSEAIRPKNPVNWYRLNVKLQR